MLRLRYGVSLGIVVFALQAFAADPNNGERLAQRWCAACHFCDTRPDQHNDRPSAAISRDCENAWV